ncbi:iron-sulfur cluster biosynthesis family protein [Metabacillus fastidiosus]|uniref:iron-sulfur cluster biosynthesis family protein n=1 Tax=Metabacillus fastidiosus TaxID=1458 RepID=UPI002E237A38|nr:iron-sulfur cluster biosynthesis family protein [Metabacillus fastidiosus]MED4530605.1 iron-sulfur cluster biosynthesis family protein [Metabacillus fastidiosus]
MEITFTKEAIEKLTDKIPSNKKLKLKYDTDGCGCVVSGVAALWIVDEIEEDDQEVETNFVPVVIEKTKMVFLDENLTISFNETANTFMLTSPSQILNPRMSLIEK